MARRSTESSRGERVFFLLVLLVTVGVASRETEIPLLEASPRAGMVAVSYWDKVSPRIRLALTCDDASATCEIRAYRSLSPLAWARPRRDEAITLPPEKAGYRIRIAKPDRTREAARGAR